MKIKNPFYQPPVNRMLVADAAHHRARLEQYPMRTRETLSGEVPVLVVAIRSANGTEQKIGHFGEN